MVTITLGQQLQLFSNVSKYRGHTGAIMEAIDGIGYVIILMLPDMNELEKRCLENEKMTVRIIKETDSFSVALIKFGSSSLIFEIAFDPTIYIDDRAMQLVLDNNLVTIIGVESNTQVIQTLRMANIPNGLRMKWISTWGSALKQQEFSERYKRWITDLRSRYSILDLWETAVYIGRLGD